MLIERATIAVEKTADWPLGGEPNGPWIPSAAGIGLSWTFHWYYSLLFFLGAIIGYAVELVSVAEPVKR